MTKKEFVSGLFLLTGIIALIGGAAYEGTNAFFDRRSADFMLPMVTTLVGLLFIRTSRYISNLK